MLTAAESYMHGCLLSSKAYSVRCWVWLLITHDLLVHHHSLLKLQGNVSAAFLENWISLHTNVTLTCIDPRFSLKLEFESNP